MARPSRLGPYVKLSATYYQDDAMLTVSPEAELLYVRGLAFCAGQMSDGFISDAQLKLVGVGIRSCTRRAAELQESGLWLRVDGGYVARSWQKWNKTAEEIGAERRRDRERKSQNRAENPEQFQADSGRNPGGVTPDSLSEIGQDRIGQDKDTDSATADASADFDLFWSIYPKRVGKGQAQKAFVKAVKRAGLDTVLNGARRLAEDPNLPDKQYIPNPTTWLNGDRWTDDPYPPRLDKHGRPPAPPSISDRLPIVGGGL